MVSLSSTSASHVVCSPLIVNVTQRISLSFSLPLSLSLFLSRNGKATSQTSKRKEQDHQGDGGSEPENERDSGLVRKKQAGTVSGLQGTRYIGTRRNESRNSGNSMWGASGKSIALRCEHEVHANVQRGKTIASSW